MFLMKVEAATESRPCLAFEGHRCLGRGDLATVARKARAALDRAGKNAVLIFDEQTGRPVEVDFRGSAEQVVERIRQAEADAASVTEAPEKRGPGRPRLGVVPREVTLLPRHWEWLNAQPGGASVALRRLVEEARRANRALDQQRESQEAVYRLMTALAGNLPGYEEALRAFYANDAVRLAAFMASWPADVRENLQRLATAALAPGAPEASRPSS